MTSNFAPRILVFAAVLAVISVDCGRIEKRTYISEPTEFSNEEPCARAGGSCLLYDECSVEIPPEYLGLCPAQRNKGAECCHGVSVKEYRCQRLGGECFLASEPCADELRILRATDCPSDEVCCALV